MTSLEFVVYSLATWRISSLLVDEAGPFDIFVKIREVLGIKHNNKIPYEYPDTFFAQLFSCVWCMSVWIGVLATVLWVLFPATMFLVSLPFAISAGAIVVHKKA